MTDLLPAPPAQAAARAPATDWAETARQFADRAAQRADGVDAHGAFPEEDFDDLDACGLLKAPLPVAHGGAGLACDPAQAHALYRVLREVGRGNLAVGRVYEGHVNALALIEEWGTDEQLATAAREAGAGHVFGVWNTEIPRDGVRLEPLPGGGVRMDGAKTFASGLGRVTRAFMNGAMPDGGWQMVLVPLDRVESDDDPSWWTAQGMRASRSGRCDVSGVRLGPEALIGQPGDYLTEPSFTGGSVRFAAVQLGAAVALAEAARAHLVKLGRTENEIQRMRLGHVAVALETGSLWLLGAARMLEHGADSESVVAYAQATRTAIEAVCLEVLEAVDRAVGARGLLTGPAERVGRDLRLYLRQPAPDATVVAVGAAYLETPGLAQGSDVTDACG